MKHVDVVVLGAGAAGLMCAGVAGQRGRSVLLIDHAERSAEKIRISGGGRCNFTNLQGDRPERFITSQPRVVRDVLRGYPPARFIELVRRHGIAYHEKHRGQLFCDESSERIIAMLHDECARGRVERWQPCAVHGLHASQAGRGEGPDRQRFRIETDRGPVSARSAVVATGGLSIPAIGATDLGYRLARQFGLRVTSPRPALVPLRFDPDQWAPFSALAGVAVPVRIATGAAAHFDEDLLFTHRGLSGPAILQISSYWQDGAELRIDLTGGQPVRAGLLAARQSGRQQTETVLSQWLPKRLAAGWLARSAQAGLLGRKLAEVGNRQIELLADALQAWVVKPTGSEGFRKAEVTVGGVALEDLDPGSLQALRQPGLHFIGEVVDVTGWLGGYNFQWAWASAVHVARTL